MSIARKVITGDSGGSGGPVYVDDVFSTSLYVGCGHTADISNGIPLGSGPAGLVQGVEFSSSNQARVNISSSTAISTDDFWLDYWFKPHEGTNPTTQFIYDTRGVYSSGAFFCWYMEGSTLNLLNYFNPQYKPWSEHPGEWAHHALVRTDGVMSFFVNGVNIYSQPNSTRFILEGSTTYFTGSLSSGSQYSLRNCSMSNFRFGIEKLGWAMPFDARESTIEVPTGPSDAYPTSLIHMFTENALVTPGTSGTDSNVFWDNVYSYTGSARQVPPGDIWTGPENITATADSPYDNGGYEGKGGLIWTKVRNREDRHGLTDTETGAAFQLDTSADRLPLLRNWVEFRREGFRYKTGDTEVNYSGYRYVNWSFAKQEGFFDVVTYTGDGVAGREIPHNLGSVPGMVIVKTTSVDDFWAVYHRAIGGQYRLILNKEWSKNPNVGFWNDTDPTATAFTVGTDGAVNGAGLEYVAYVFAHDAQEFGPNGDESIIKCGAINSTNYNGAEEDLGWEPQWILVKNQGESDWEIIDNKRGASLNQSEVLHPNLRDAEVTSGAGVQFTANGFTQYLNATSNDGIYMAVRNPDET